jgi:uncharacterized SAM-binding protein YcdF (DUF218 family)
LRPRLARPIRFIAIPIAVVAALLALTGIARYLAPVSNTSSTHFDAIIVLGFPANKYGNPTPEQLARVTEGVNEFKLGIAPRLILTGGAARNNFVEARVMARSAEAQGVPKSAIFVEPNSLDTIQNACYAVRIMKAHGWRSAEIVSSARQLPRAALILGRLNIDWRTHVAPPLSPLPTAYVATIRTTEFLKTTRYLIWARWTERCNP